MNEHVESEQVVEEQLDVLLTIAARLTGYPTLQFHEELQDLRAYANEMLLAGEAKDTLLAVIHMMASMSLREIREFYVGAFDLKDRTGLYLTGHELGDSRKRGVALLEMREFIRLYGFEPCEDELPDYLPLLYELVAVVPMDEEVRHLMARLAFATQRIRIHLPDDNPYKPIFAVLMQTVFEEPTDELMQERERKREKPDLDPMPYPLMYK